MVTEDPFSDISIHFYTGEKHLCDLILAEGDRIAKEISNLPVGHPQVSLSVGHTMHVYPGTYEEAFTPFILLDLPRGPQPASAAMTIMNDAFNRLTEAATAWVRETGYGLPWSYDEDTEQMELNGGFELSIFTRRQRSGMYGFGASFILGEMFAEMFGGPGVARTEWEGAPDDLKEWHLAHPVVPGP